ncbi:ATP-binding protein [Halorussus halophilus]|uniref:ATP-binding protein n=1 Tax=Halorussus halophilus TaxID=2650975 RepID=UPI001301715A
MGDDQTITVTDDGFTLPVVEVLTGRGFITGKSGSGKSNTASVVAEELLEQNVPLLVIDTDGEYYGLKEAYEMLHVGGDDACDVRVGVEHADGLAELALEENVPVILDVSGYADHDEVEAVIDAVVGALFRREKSARKPFLLFVEEMHEFVPESGGLGDVGETLVRVAKRGRKRGLGLCGMSQRPAAVDKDFITQCDWIAWHRLTWENDTKVVGRILGTDAESTVQELGDGEALLMTDWDESVQRVQFRRKRTFDAGATPGLDDFDRPDLQTVSEDVVAALETVETDADPASADADVAELREQLREKEERIEELETEVERLRGEETDDSGGGGKTSNRTVAGEQSDTPLSEFGHLVVHLLGWVGRRCRAAGRWAVERSSAATQWFVDVVSGTRADDTETDETDNQAQHDRLLAVVLLAVTLLVVLISTALLGLALLP